MAGRLNSNGKGRCKQCNGEINLLRNCLFSMYIISS